jgi:multidrug efflux pump subunit AcrA (membrane-fusion protein)
VSAIRAEGGTQVVYVLKDGKAEQRTVTLGGTVGEERQLLSGVRAGDTVITDPPAQLKDGMAVSVAKS